MIGYIANILLDPETTRLALEAPEADATVAYFEELLAPVEHYEHIDLCTNDDGQAWLQAIVAKDDIRLFTEECESCEHVELVNIAGKL